MWPLALISSALHWGLVWFFSPKQQQQPKTARAVRATLINQAFVSLPCLLLGARFVSSSSNIRWHLAPVLAVGEDVLFYSAHRLFHASGTLYRLFHKQHHGWVDTRAIASQDAHPVEHLVCNVAPVAALAWLLHMNEQEVSVWVCTATASAVTAHLGGTFHATHHRLQNVNFGVLGLMDRLMGTYHK